MELAHPKRHKATAYLMSSATACHSGYNSSMYHCGRPQQTRSAGTDLGLVFDPLLCALSPRKVTAVNLAYLSQANRSDT